MAAGSKIGEAYVELRAKMAKFESELKSAEVLTGKSVGRMQAKFKALAPTFRKVGIGMAVAGGAITAALGLAIKSSIDFNKEMANIATLIPGATKRVIELKSAIRTMAVDVGKDTADLAQGAYQVISAFGDTADTVAILKMSAKAATAGVATTTEAINLLSAVTKGYGDKSKEAVLKASDLAFQTVTLGQTTFPELAASIGKVIPLTAELGVSQEELFAVMATGTGVTGKAAEVSTQLRGIMQSLMSPTADMTKLFEKMGYTSGKAMLAEKGLAGSLEIIKNEANASNMPLQKYISSIEGQTLALALTGTQAGTYIEKLAAMRDSIGLTDIAFKEQTEGINKTGFAFQQAKIRIGVLGQEIGDRLLPMITPLIEKITDLVKKMSDWAKEHPRLSSGIVKFAAVLGPLLIGLGGLMMILPGLVAIAPLVGAAFTIMTGPIGIIITAIGLAVAAFIYFYKTNETFRKGVQKTGAYLEFFGRVVAGVFKAVGANIGNFLGWFSVEFPNVFKDILSAVGTILKNLGANIAGWVKYLGTKLNPKNWLKKIEPPDWTPLLEGFEATVTEIPKLIGINLDEAKGILEKKLTAIGAEFQAVTPAIDEMGDKIVDAGKKGSGALEELKGATGELTEADKKLQEQLAKLRGQEYIRALEEMIKRAKEQKERTEEQEAALKALQERLEKVRGTEYIRAVQNMILRQIEQKERAEEQVEALKKLQERLSELRGEQYIKGLENMITRAIEQKERTEEQEKALKELQERLTKLRGQEYIQSLEEMIKRAQEQKDRTEEQEKELQKLKQSLDKLRGEAYLEALANMIKHAIEQKDRTEEQEKALKKLQDRLKALRATEYIRALQNMILRQIEQKERAEEQEKALKALQERLAKLRGTEYIRALENMITRQKEQKERTEEQEKALKELQERLKKLRGKEYIRALEEMIKRQIEMKERTEETLEVIKKGYNKIVEGAKKWYTAMSGYSQDWSEYTQEDLEKIVRAFQAASERIKQNWGAAFKLFTTELWFTFKTIAIEKLGDLGKAIQGFADIIRGKLTDEVTTLAIGIMALADSFVGLFFQSDAFKKLMEIINPVIQMVADTFGALLKPLLPIVQVLANVLKPILQALAPIFELLGMIIKTILIPILSAFWPVIKILMWLMAKFAQALAFAWKWIAKVFGVAGYHAACDMIEAMGKLADEIWDMENPFDNLEESTEENTEATKENTEAKKGQTEAEKRLTIQTGDLTGQIGEENRTREENISAIRDEIKNFIALGVQSRKFSDKLVTTASNLQKFDLGKLIRPVDLENFVTGVSLGNFVKGVDLASFIQGRFPSAQIGIPYIPRTMPVIVHKKEAILNPPQAREWRAGRKAGGEGNVTFQRGAVVMRVQNLNTKADVEELVGLVEDTITKTIEKKIRGV